MKSCYAQTECDDDTDSNCYTFDEEGYGNGACHLDKCNGRITAVPENYQDALGTEIYAYYMTVDDAENPAFPYLPYCYRGNVESGSSNGGSPSEDRQMEVSLVDLHLSLYDRKIYVSVIPTKHHLYFENFTLT